MINYLRELIKIPSVSGAEGKIADYIKGEMEKYFDTCETDNLGNLVCRKKGEGKRLAFCAHMDEIGFIVTTIDDKGYIHFATVGGINFAAAAYSNVVFANGLRGIMVPEDGLKGADYAAERFAVDIGAKSKKQAERYVKTGDTFVVEPSYTRLKGGKVCGRAFDDKIGCAILMAAARNAAEFKNDVSFIFSTQEEVGIRGARVAAFNSRPDYAVAIDVTLAGEAYGAKPATVSMGGGAAVKYKDASVICDGAFVRKMEAIADEAGISHQADIISRGGTDTAAFQITGSGAVVGGISIPMHYMHTAVETFEISDAEACRDLVVAIAKSEL